MAKINDRLASDATVHDFNGSRRVATDTGQTGLGELRDVHFFEVRDDLVQDIGKLRAELRKHCGNNGLDEIILRRDDGKLVVLYTDDVSEKVKEGHYLTAGEVRGWVESVQREWDVSDAGNVLKGRVVTAIGVTAGAVFSGLTHQNGEDIIKHAFALGRGLAAEAADTRDTTSYDKLRNTTNGPTTPASALQPPAASGGYTGRR